METILYVSAPFLVYSSFMTPYKLTSEPCQHWVKNGPLPEEAGHALSTTKINN